MLAALVPTPRYWVGWPLTFGMMPGVSAALMGGFAALMALALLPTGPRLAVYLGFVVIIAAAFQLPWLVAPAVFCAGLGLARWYSS